MPPLAYGNATPSYPSSSHTDFVGKHLFHCVWKAEGTICGAIGFPTMHNKPFGTQRLILCNLSGREWSTILWLSLGTKHEVRLRKTSGTFS